MKPVVKHTPIKITSATNKQKEEARRLLLADYENRLTIRKLARKLRTNDFKLKKQFKAVFGMGIFECLQHERLEKAKELLARGEHTVAEIAYMTGYEHPRNFSIAFKRRFGVRPGEVRKDRLKMICWEYK